MSRLEEDPRPRATMERKRVETHKRIIQKICFLEF
tara:strand:+ start:1439 stop:1543 length:105 start_codon:yes stop_codon:yes gene_type:complete